MPRQAMMLRSTRRIGGAIDAPGSRRRPRRVAAGIGRARRASALGGGHVDNLRVNVRVPHTKPSADVGDQHERCGPAPRPSRPAPSVPVVAARHSSTPCHSGEIHASGLQPRRELAEREERAREQEHRQGEEAHHEGEACVGLLRWRRRRSAARRTPTAHRTAAGMARTRPRRQRPRRAIGGDDQERRRRHREPDGDPDRGGRRSTSAGRIGDATMPW